MSIQTIITPEEWKALSPDSRHAINLYEKREEFNIKVLSFFAAYDIHDEVWWQVANDHLTWMVNCNDEFSWGCADCEEITPENLPLLQQTMADVLAIDENAESAAIELFAARVRQMRPQDASYPGYNKLLWPLFDACGPEREKGFGNPYTREMAEREYAIRHPEAAIRAAGGESK